MFVYLNAKCANWSDGECVSLCVIAAERECDAIEMRLNTHSIPKYICGEVLYVYIASMYINHYMYYVRRTIVYFVYVCAYALHIHINMLLVHRGALFVMRPFSCMCMGCFGFVSCCCLRAQQI